MGYYGFLNGILKDVNRFMIYCIHFWDNFLIGLLGCDFLVSGSVEEFKGSFKITNDVSLFWIYSILNACEADEDFWPE